MQPTSGYSYKRVSGTAAGTTVIKDAYGYLKGLAIGQNKEGTVTIYDNASGAAADDYLSAIDNNAGSIPTSLNFDMRFKKGLTAVVGGTTDMLFIYQ